VQYANLAIRGRLLKQILDEQVEPAIELRPELVSLWGGGNDMLRVDSDPDKMAAQMERAVGRLRSSGIDVLLFLGVDTKDSPIIGLARKRTAVYNLHLSRIAREHGCYLVDSWGMRVLMDFRLWADDRIHLNSEGHRRVANACLATLGLEPELPNWKDPLPPEAERSLRQTAEWHRDWLVQHVGPWLGRRARGVSSGDGRTAKHPGYVSVPPSK
jgi:lysophospholipase L1-like esterase